MPTHAHLFPPFFPVHLKAQRCGNKFQLFTTATRIITNRTHTNTRTYTRTRYLEKRAQICTPLMSFSAYLFPRRWLPPLFDSHVLSVAFSEQWQLKKKHTQAGNGFVLFSFSAFTIPRSHSIHTVAQQPCAAVESWWTALSWLMFCFSLPLGRNRKNEIRIYLGGRRGFPRLPLRYTDLPDEVGCQFKVENMEPGQYCHRFPRSH